MKRKVCLPAAWVCGILLGLLAPGDLRAQTANSGSQRSVLVTPPRGAVYGSPQGSEATREVADRIRRARLQRGETVPPEATEVPTEPRLIESRMPGRPALPGVTPLETPADTLPPGAYDPAALDEGVAGGPPDDEFVPRIAREPATAPPTAFPSALGAPPDRRLQATDESAAPNDQTSGSENLVLTSQGPVLRVETLGPRSVVLGKPARYRVSVINEGAQDALETFVRIVLPEWVEIVGGDATIGETQRQPDGAGGARIVWTIGRIAARARENLDLQLIPRQNQPIDMKVDWTFRPAVQTAQILVKQAQLTMDIAGPAEIQYGDTATYTVTLSNPGNGDAENVSLDVATAQGAVQTRQIGVVPAGGKELVELELFARDAGALAITGVATGDAGLRAEAARNVIVRRAQLQLQIRGSEYKYAGTQGEYLIRVSNVGDATAANIALAGVLPRGAEYLSGVEGAEGGNGRVDWKIANLAPGAHRDYLIRCNLPLPGTLRFQVHAVADGDLTATGECQTVVESVADLKLVVNDPKGPLPVGKDVMYEVRVINRGTKAAESVKVVAQFSHGIEPVTYEGGEAELVTGQVLFKPIRSLGPGETLVLKIFARAQEAGNHRFRTEVTCSDQETQLVFEDTTKYFISKSFEVPDPQSPLGGDFPNAAGDAGLKSPGADEPPPNGFPTPTGRR